MAEEPEVPEADPLVTAADEYFTTHLDSAKWSALTDAQKLAALTTAQADINSLPLRKKFDTDGITIIDVMPEATKNAMIYEQALFLTIITADRQNLQAQGVKSVGISGGASETYAKLTYGVPLAPRAKLQAFGYWAIGGTR